MKKIELKLPLPHAGQRKFLSSRARFRVLQCGRRWGKSLIAASCAIRKMLAGRKVAYVTPEYDLAEEFFNEMLLKLPAELLRTVNKTRLTISLITGGRIKFFSGEAISKMRGRKFHLIIVDEAAFIKDLSNSWLQVMRPTLTDFKGDAIFISTPKGRGYFDSLFNKGVSREDDFESFSFTSYDNPTLDPSEIDAAKKELPESLFNQEYLAIPGEDAANAFGSANIRNGQVEVFSTKRTVCYGIDVAKYNDFTVIFGMDEDGHMTYFDRFKMPWEVTKQKIRELPPDPLKIMDATGVGDVIFEELAADVMNLEGFVFTAQTKPSIIYELIKDVEKGNVKYNKVTADEMSVFEFKHTVSGGIKFEAMAGYHDDCVAAMALANRYRKLWSLGSEWRLYKA